MKLRRRKQLNLNLTVLSRRQLPESNPRSPRTPRKARTTATMAESPLLPVHTKDEVEPDSAHSDDEDFVPMATRRPMVRGRGRRRVVAAADSETDTPFKTPLRSAMRRRRALAEIDPGSPGCNVTSRSIYTPIVRFLSPTKENQCSPCRVPGSGDVLMSPTPEQCVFGYGSGSMGLLSGDEDNDEVFNPCTFVKNIPSRSQQSTPVPRDIPPKTRSMPDATMVLDLDETLMFSSLSVIPDAEYSFQTPFQDHQYKVYMTLRPGVQEFLQSMSKVYELFIYTSAKKSYAEKILDVLDPKRNIFRHRLYQQDCVCVLGHYIKDLEVLERDLSKMVVLDNSPHTYPYHMMNTIPVKSWSGDQTDRELHKLIPYLEKLSGAEDFREVLKRRKDHFHRLLSED